MGRARQKFLISLAAFLLLAASFTLVLPLLSQKAEAQNNSDDGDDSVEIVYSSRYINKVIPGNRGNDKIRQVYAFPDGGPVFITRTNDALTVWARRENGLSSLRQIDLGDEALEEIVFLDDNRTFIVHTLSQARVYSVDREVVRQQTRTVRRR